tara:strand:+ start:270 stop:1871 length:1602 start_codon:yes stop_codon:yes gene_type:complete
VRNFLKNLFRRKDSSQKKLTSEVGKEGEQDFNKEHVKDKNKNEIDNLYLKIKRDEKIKRGKKSQVVINTLKAASLKQQKNDFYRKEKDKSSLNKIKTSRKNISKKNEQVLDEKKKLEIYNAAVVREELKNDYTSILVNKNKNEWELIHNPNKKEENIFYKKCLAEVKKIEKEAEVRGLKMTWTTWPLNDNCKQLNLEKYVPIYLSKDQLKQKEFTEEEIQNTQSKWERKPSYEFLLPDWNATVIAGRWVRGRLNYLQMRKNFHLYNVYQLRKLFGNKWSFSETNETITFYIVKIKVPLNNKKEFIIYKPGICANKVLGGRYKKNNGNKIQSVIEVRNIHWHVAECLEEKTQYYMQPRPWLPQLYSHELIDSDMHGFFNDFYYKDFEMFEERYGYLKNEIWNFNRKILDEIKNAQKRLAFSRAENKYLAIKSTESITWKDCGKKDKEAKKKYDQEFKEIKKLRKKLRSEYFKKIPKPKYSDKSLDWPNLGETEWMTWDDSEEKLLEWIKLLLSFEKEKLDKYKNVPQVVFQKSI